MEVALGELGNRVVGKVAGQVRAQHDQEACGDHKAQRVARAEIDL
jgi:hypothetical protein